ncbi:g6702 [Coccomyxa elongata]
MFLVRGKACRVAVAFTLLLLGGDLPVWSANDTQSIKAAWQPTQDSLSCAKRFGTSQKVTFIMVADPGTYSGTPESSFYVGAVQSKNDIPANVTSCSDLLTGTIFNQPVVVATSGIGPVAAALCTTEMLQCSSLIKDFIYVGTSGWSSQLGGVLNAPGSCKEANPPRDLARIGDIAVTPYAANWACKLADYSGQCKGAPNLCSYPEEIYGPQEARLYGSCIFTAHSKATLSLADELISATRTPQFAANIAALATDFEKTIAPYETEYFAAMSNGTGHQYNFPPWHGPRVWDYNVAAEIDSQFFYSGVPWDMVARNYTAQTLILATGKSLTQYDVIAVSAMEAVGVAPAINLHNGMSGYDQVPYVFVRANSDYLYQPIQRAKSGNGWETVDNPPPANNSVNFRFAIGTSSTAVLTMLQLRCFQSAGNNATACAYTPLQF